MRRQRVGFETNACHVIRNRKFLLFCALGFGGGALGALLAEIAPRGPAGAGLLVFHTAIWSALCISVLTASLFWASEIYHRRPGFFSRTLVHALSAGALAGGLAGGVAQAVYLHEFASDAIQNLVVRPFCWGIMGALVGWRLINTIPNLGRFKAILGGGIGGSLGGLAFLLTSALFGEVSGRMLGVGLLGAALGVAVVLTEMLFRSASLEIVWAPKEVTTVTLGSCPVTIGGGDDHIHVAGLPQHAAAVTLENGKVEYVDSSSGQRTPLKNGSKIKIGSVEVIIRAR